MAHTVALPQLPDGRTYITREMMENQPEVLAFYERTRNSWYQDPVSDVFYMHMSGMGYVQVSIEVPDEPV